MSGGFRTLDVAEHVRNLVHDCAPLWDTDDLREDLVLGSAGVGLDSVALVHLLLACEERFGVRLPQSLLDGEALTLSHLVVEVARALHDQGWT